MKKETLYCDFCKVKLNKENKYKGKDKFPFWTKIATIVGDNYCFCYIEIDICKDWYDSWKVNRNALCLKEGKK